MSASDAHKRAQTAAPVCCWCNSLGGVSPQHLTKSWPYARLKRRANSPKDHQTPPHPTYPPPPPPERSLPLQPPPAAQIALPAVHSAPCGSASKRSVCPAAVLPASYCRQPGLCGFPLLPPSGAPDPCSTLCSTAPCPCSRALRLALPVWKCTPGRAAETRPQGGKWSADAPKRAMPPQNGSTQST